MGRGCIPPGRGQHILLSGGRDPQRPVNRAEASIGLGACEGGNRHGLRWTAVAEIDLQLT